MHKKQKNNIMHRVSSNFTLFFKFFIPVLWSVFFGLFTIALFVVHESDLPFLTSTAFKFPFLIFYILFFLFLYFTFFQLRRVELGDETSYYVSTYFKHFMLIYEDIKEVKVIKAPFFTVYTIRLKAKSKLGLSITFLADQSAIVHFLKSETEGASAFNVKIKDNN